MVDSSPALGGDGIVVLRSAIEPELCIRIRESLAGWARRHPDFGEKYQDAWVKHRPVRDLACHPRIMAELEHRYGRRPIPFQTLDFARGTEQPLHADSIHFDSVPSGWMCGVWVALEEVGPDQGPLTLVPGSQRVAPLAFEAVAEGPSGFDARSYETALAGHLSTMVTEEFLASPGDALIWHADLAHGGAIVRDPGSTRWSQVTHYFFDGFTYVTPMLADRKTGTIHLREPLLDVSTLRVVNHAASGHAPRITRLGGGAAQLSWGDDHPCWPQRAASRSRAIYRRLRGELRAVVGELGPRLHTLRYHRWRGAARTSDGPEACHESE